MSASASAEAGKVFIVGKIVSVRKAGTLFEHLIKTAAPDPYSSPATLSVLSQTRLGSSEDEYKGTVRLTGYARSYKQTDQETGEVRTVKTADNKLFAE